MQKVEYAIQFVNGEYFSDSGVMVEDLGSVIVACVEVPQPGLGPANKGAVAEYHPRLLRSGDKCPPERLERRRSVRDRIMSGEALCRVARREERHDEGHGRTQQHGQNRNCEIPAPGVGLGWSCRSLEILRDEFRTGFFRAVRPLMKRQNVSAFWQLDNDIVVKPLIGVVLSQLEA